MNGNSSIAEFIDLTGGGPQISTPAAPRQVPPTPTRIAAPTVTKSPEPPPPAASVRTAPPLGAVPIGPGAAPSPATVPAGPVIAMPLQAIAPPMAVGSPADAQPQSQSIAEDVGDEDGLAEEFEGDGLMCEDDGGVPTAQGVMPPVSPVHVVKETAQPTASNVVPPQAPAAPPPAAANQAIDFAAACAGAFDQTFTSVAAAGKAPANPPSASASATPPVSLPAAQSPVTLTSTNAAGVPLGAPAPSATSCPAFPSISPANAAGAQVGTIGSAPPHDQDYADSMSLRNEIADEIGRLKQLSGLGVMADPNACDQRNIIHVAVCAMYHNPVGLVQMSVHDLNTYEAALSAHQVYIQSLENEWNARYQYLGREEARLKRRHRSRYKGETEREREEAVIDNEPEMQQLYRAFLKAKAVAEFMRDMGQRFAQLEDGLKRTINMRQAEEDRQRMQQRFQS